MALQLFSIIGNGAAIIFPSLAMALQLIFTS
jgi:hypothetical protein